MKYTRLGKSGVKVSKICFGCMGMGEEGNKFFPWVIGEADSKALIRQSLEAGINFFDTANAYSLGESEEHLGRILSALANRDEVVIATKGFFGWSRGPNSNGNSRKALTQQLDASLKRLGTEYVDLYQIHRFDVDTPIEETMEVLHDFVKQGKVRYIGASSMYTRQFQNAQNVAEKNGWTKFVSMQCQVSLVYREEEREMLPYCQETGVGVIPWSPLGGGILTRDWDETTKRSETGRQSRDESYAAYGEVAAPLLMEHDRRVVDEVAKIADEKGVSRAQVGLAWHYTKPSISSPIVGITKEKHLTDALAALELELSDEDVARLERNYLTRPMVHQGTDNRRRWNFKMTVNG